MFHVTYFFPIEKDNPKIIFSIFVVNFTSFADKNYYYFPDFVFAYKRVYANPWFLLLLIDASTFLVLTTGPLKLFLGFFDVSVQFKIMTLTYLVHWVSAIV